MKEGLIKGNDDKVRCWWPAEHEDYLRYHDDEWGHHVTDDIRLFEKICLEGFQAGLSWLTILRKRKNFRAGFAGFDFKKVASFGDGDVERLMQDAGIVRHRGKILSTINNAKQAIELTQEFGSLYEYFQTYRPEVRPERCDFSTLSQITKTDESTAMSKDLKKRGWSFVGPTTCYAFMQAMGLVNDHIEGCFMREQLKKISLPETGSEKS
ncbi:DNA-3-methyladenine glycosylase I [Akkermansiaceae bacterium]|nr:DNA-3-methyladenine glycosylase I [Akkermansiaceae bacterium]MDB4732343.1 DNA-3-methyladenine glycosylase I [bacterium]MDA7864190.1 DNA-3-methyladenine glycosylase I [Akkermansiaceae bacterium]MDA8876271.1 DNA-3-methyladenine glycosylase I [Akkermansiaceae bacterium]MDB0056244.1 DNA-3-methyladenine glycosylase I [Akkermansiaceae bacterium]